MKEVNVDSSAKWKPMPLTGAIGRYPFMHPNDDME